jgi:hypothetical protein
MAFALSGPSFLVVVVVVFLAGVVAIDNKVWLNKKLAPSSFAVFAIPPL